MCLPIALADAGGSTYPEYALQILVAGGQRAGSTPQRRLCPSEILVTSEDGPLTKSQTR
jgi:hypothetical protein